jgi:hypothetical protein
VCVPPIFIGREDLSYTSKPKGGSVFDYLYIQGIQGSTTQEYAGDEINMCKLTSTEKHMEEKETTTQLARSAPKFFPSDLTKPAANLPL